MEAGSRDRRTSFSESVRSFVTRDTCMAPDPVEMEVREAGVSLPEEKASGMSEGGVFFKRPAHTKIGDTEKRVGEDKDTGRGRN